VIVFNPSKLLRLVGIFLFSFLFLTMGSKIDLCPYDEGIAAYGATRILDGDVPYRDFWTIYAPGQFYTLALLFKLFGPSVIVERVFTITVQSLIAFCAYLIVEKASKWRLAVIPWLMIITWFGRYNFFGSPMPTALLLSMISCLALMRFFGNKSKKWLVLAGVFTSLTALFRHDIGIYTFIAESMVIIAFEYSDPLNRSSGVCKNISKIASAYCHYLFAVIVILLPICIFFVSAVGAGELLSNLFIFPIKVFPEFRGTPYPPPCPNPMLIANGNLSVGRFLRKTLEYFPFYFPFIILPIIILHLADVIRTKCSLTEKHWLIILMFLISLTFFNQVRVRSDSVHLMPTLIPLSIIFPLLLIAFPKQKNDKINNKIRKILVFVSIMLALSFGRHFIRLIGRKLYLSPSTANLVSLELPRSKGIRLKPQDAEPLQKAVRYIQRTVPPQSRIFVGTFRHDKIAINNIMFYFLSERRSATKFHELHPGLATTSAIQRQIISDIKKHSVTHLVLWDIAENMIERKGKSSNNNGATELDEFINSNYQEIEVFGDFRILTRKS